MFADGQPGLTTAAEWHTDFALAAGQGMVLLSQASLGDPRVLDYVAYNLRVPGRSYGSISPVFPAGGRLPERIAPASRGRSAAQPVVAVEPALASAAVAKV